jgi:hypothetical protein
MIAVPFRLSCGRLFYSIEGGGFCQFRVFRWECPNAQLKKIKKGKGDRRAWMSGTIAVLLKPEAVIGPYENS